MGKYIFYYLYIKWTLLLKRCTFLLLVYDSENIIYITVIQRINDYRIIF